MISTMFRQGFRPFFLAAGVWACASLGIWVLWITGYLDMAAVDPLHWHAHEMLFGYTGAAITGFILTAIPNWTRRLPVRGIPLALLLMVWIAGRAACLMQDQLGAVVVMAVDVSFPILVFGIVLREIIAGKNWRNLPVAGVLGLFAAASVVDHLSTMDIVADDRLGQRMGLAVIIMLIGLIGGRVVPSFTGNWLNKQGATVSPVLFSGFDKFSLVILLAALVLWCVVPDHMVTGWTLVFAGVCHGFRLFRWRGYATCAEILVLILHIGYGWIALGLLLMGLEIVWPGALPLSGLHAITAGGIATMTLAMMTRATLGHTGQELTADPGTTIIYGLVTMGAVLRVLVPVFPSEAFQSILGVSAIFWIAGFALFVIIYAPLLAGMGQQED
ncbi:MAG: NnrS family protein [Rhodospirillales bacterium]|jgi:uncharacterized protein involved in response to NO|nr:NnrS family protein [Rhodospirillales bacterium]MBT4039135.1 NnrS family protein [Rhodospirillales bacterium]MBT4625536.1 NnrS family protein [Rhodospirillales bacterium]MBT5352175.1 NnrS family protein [Rhodospirillales bacterium]MBT5520276.1 NnrS family protein [Rhodospirillales bacterium]